MASTSGSGTKPKTRKDNEVWLIGPTAHALTGLKLPSTGEVMSLFFQIHKVNKATIKESAKEVIKQVLPFWEMARIPTCSEIHARERVEKMFVKWKSLQKAAKRRSQAQQIKEEVFKEQLSKLFDIAHANALTMIKIEEDRQFLLAQREGRKGYLGRVDKELAAKEAQDNESG
ncbi:uncharacterized protein LOC121872269 [Homarus americanus]|uniref:uncharacterized protein LOC121872269 n=1 Tax=Homarus americanus TaxID=6706 RepID=UPI001C47F161|nr:uncharacterized protein LOC121872269 [Homarus americanus]